MQRNSTFRLPAEWEPQSGILITWPHKQSDWVTKLHEIEPLYVQLSHAILRFQKLLVVAYDESLIEHIKQLLALGKTEESRILFSIQKTNDTWTRDYGPITLRDNSKLAIADFTFNGWGNKFSANLDTEVTVNLVNKKDLNCDTLTSHSFVLEGGSIDSDGCGTLLTTSACLLTDTRNPTFSKKDVESFLSKMLNINNILWLDHGYLAGDDTDSHIDMLARFTDENTIAYVKCEDHTDEHFTALAAMETQLKSFRNKQGEPYQLVALPFPAAIFDPENNNRLPASYANFLIMNDTVLVPLYGDKQDQTALNCLQHCFPDREIIGINFSAAIKQGGSLHCLTMQLPEGLL